VTDEGGCVWALQHPGGANHPDWGVNNPVSIDGSPIYHSPSWDGGDNLYVATTGGNIYQIDVATGAVNWTYSEPDGDAFNTAVVVGTDGVYAHSVGATPQRFKLDAAGNEVWRVDMPPASYGYGTPTLGPKKVYFPVDHPSSGLLIVNQENGVAEYNFADDGIGRVCMPATLVCNEYMFISDREGGWHLVDVVYFERVWSRYFHDYPFGTALATTPGLDEILRTEDDGHYAVMSIWSDAFGPSSYAFGAVFCWDLDGDPRPMMEILKPEITVEVPLGAGLVTGETTTDVFENRSDYAPLNITDLNPKNVDPSTAMKITPKVSKVSKTHARKAEQTSETKIGTDYLSFFDAEGNLTKHGLMSGMAASAVETPDMALHQSKITYRQSKARATYLATQAQTLRTQNVALNPAGPINGGGKASLTWDYDGTGLGRGIDIEAIEITHDDPDYFPECALDPAGMPPPEIIINYVGGCVFEWLESLYFEYDFRHVEQVSNFGAFGDGTGYGLDWGDGNNAPIYDAGIFLLTDNGPYWQAEFYDWERCFLPDPAPISGVCGIDYQDYIPLGRSMWFDCLHSPDPGMWPQHYVDYIYVEGDVAWCNYIDSVEAAGDAYGVKIYQVEIGTYDLDDKYGNFKLLHFKIVNREPPHGNTGPIDDIIFGMWFDWDVGDAYSNQGVLACQVGGYAIHDSVDPSTGFGNLIMPAYLSPDNSCEVEVAGYHLLWCVNNEWHVDCWTPVWPCCLSPVGDPMISIACISTGGYFGAPDACGGDADMPGWWGAALEDMGGLFAWPMFDLPNDGDEHHLYGAVIGVDATSNDQATIRGEIEKTSFKANKWAGFNRGDVNDDGCVDACDLAYLDAYLGGAGIPIFPYDDTESISGGNGDVNVNGITEAGDLMYLFDYLMGFGPPPGGAWRFPFMP